MEHICSQEKNILHLESKLKTQKQLGEETFAKVSEVEDSLNKHREAQQIHEKELATFMSNTNSVMDIVNKQLLPAYKKEEKAEIAKAWIKEQAVSGKFWISVLVAIMAFLGILGVVIKQSLQYYIDKRYGIRI